MWHSCRIAVPLCASLCVSMRLCMFLGTCFAVCMCGERTRERERERERERQGQTCIYVYACICMYMYAYVCTCVYVYMYVYVCIWLYRDRDKERKRERVSVCVHLYVHMYMYIDVYILTWFPMQIALSVLLLCPQTQNDKVPPVFSTCSCCLRVCCCFAQTKKFHLHSNILGMQLSPQGVLLFRPPPDTKTTNDMYFSMFWNASILSGFVAVLSPDTKATYWLSVWCCFAPRIEEHRVLFVVSGCVAVLPPNTKHTQLHLYFRMFCNADCVRLFPSVHVVYIRLCTSVYICVRLCTSAYLDQTESRQRIIWHPPCAPSI